MQERMVVQGLTLVLAAAVACPSLAVPANPDLSKAHRRQTASRGPGDVTEMSRVVEIRSYNLKAGTRERFQQLFEREALPLLRRWKVDVVAYGPSLHDRDSFYLMRAFSSVEDRQRSEDAFYESNEWRKGPREAILACIESYATVVIRLDRAALQALRRAGEASRSQTRE